MTTAEMLQSIKAQRAAIAWYAERIRDLDRIAHELNAAKMHVHARKAEHFAWIARTAARREAEPEAGA